MKNELKTLDPATANALSAVLIDEIHEESPEGVMALLERNEKGQVKNCLTNTALILSADPLLHGSVRFNELTQRIDIINSPGWDRPADSSAFTDNDLYNIHLYCEKTYGISSIKLIEEAVHLTAYRNAYHPIRELLNSLEWDGQERIRYALHRYLGADESDYTYGILKYFMLGAVSRVFKPGIKFDDILCLVGAQGAGKSSFFRILAINDEWFTGDLKDLESSKVYEKLQGHWIIEMSEMLATNNAKSIDAIKGFLSRQKETYRTPYERYPKDRPRQCVFGGTTNKLAFLPNDRTGNRRFLPILCRETDAESFILDDEEQSREYIRQMWAEVMEIYRSGPVRLKLSPELEAEVRLRQKDFMQEDVNAGIILNYMQDYEGTKVCSKQLFSEALLNGGLQPQRWQTNEINDIMNQLIREGSLPGWRYFDKPRRFGPVYGSQKGWERISDVNEEVSTEDGFRPVRPEDHCPFPD